MDPRYININFTEDTLPLQSSNDVAIRLRPHHPKPASATIPVELPLHKASDPISEIELKTIADIVIGRLAMVTRRMKDKVCDLRLIFPPHYNLQMIENYPSIKTLIDKYMEKNWHLYVVHNASPVQWANFNFVAENSAINALIENEMLAENAMAQAMVSAPPKSVYPKATVISALDQMSMAFAGLQFDDDFYREYPDFKIHADQYFAIEGLQPLAFEAPNKGNNPERWLQLQFQVAQFGRPVDRVNLNADGSENSAPLSSVSIRARVNPIDLSVIEETMVTPLISASAASSSATPNNGTPNIFLPELGSPRSLSNRYATCLYDEEGRTPLSRRQSSPSMLSPTYPVLPPFFKIPTAASGAVSEDILMRAISPNAAMTQSNLVTAAAGAFSPIAPSASTISSSNDSSASSSAAPSSSPAALSLSASPAISPPVVSAAPAATITIIQKRYWILAVDDAVINTKMLAKAMDRFLKGSKHPLSAQIGVLTCEDSAEAALFALHNPNACLLMFIDHNMPGWDGPLGARVIRGIINHEINNPVSQKNIRLPHLVCLSGNSIETLCENVNDARTIYDDLIQNLLRRKLLRIQLTPL